jgi:hypothetical protein
LTLSLQDPTAVSPSASVEEATAIFNRFCFSGYCNTQTAACEAGRRGIGEDCSNDPDFVRLPLFYSILFDSTAFRFHSLCRVLR